MNIAMMVVIASVIMGLWDGVFVVFFNLKSSKGPVGMLTPL